MIDQTDSDFTSDENDDEILSPSIIQSNISLWKPFSNKDILLSWNSKDGYSIQPAVKDVDSSNIFEYVDTGTFSALITEYIRIGHALKEKINTQTIHNQLNIAFDTHRRQKTVFFSKEEQNDNSESSYRTENDNDENLKSSEVSDASYRGNLLLASQNPSDYEEELKSQDNIKNPLKEKHEDIQFTIKNKQQVEREIKSIDCLLQRVIQATTSQKSFHIKLSSLNTLESLLTQPTELEVIRLSFKEQIDRNDYKERAISLFSDISKTLSLMNLRILAQSLEVEVKINSRLQQELILDFDTISTQQILEIYCYPSTRRFIDQRSYGTIGAKGEIVKNIVYVKLCSTVKTLITNDPNIVIDIKNESSYSKSVIVHKAYIPTVCVVDFLDFVRNTKNTVGYFHTRSFSDPQYLEQKYYVEQNDESIDLHSFDGEDNSIFYRPKIDIKNNTFNENLQELISKFRYYLNVSFDTPILFTAYDIFSKLLSQVATQDNGKEQTFKLEEFIHAKTIAMMVMIACEKHVKNVLIYSPLASLCDLYY